ncbi:hypothetical protein V8G54_010097 [Vigna mungo]|uniref:(+)-neomenthol dehydrogenase n=1 Tax=Vigna mungo TaxID=3915 RepID=A0AAQ3NVS6_VIGMU
MGEATERYAVVTGANKGIGLEIVRQLASEGIKVVLTARNEERGLQAFETLKASPLSHLLFFHQLDVAHATSVASFADFIKSKFGKLDILVNNAGINGIVIEDRDLFTKVLVNRGSFPKESWARGVLSDGDNLTEEKVDEIVKKFLSDFKEGSLESKGWPKYLGAYIVSKAAMNGYTRILAKKHPSFCINSVCPGYVKTDITSNTGFLTVEEGAASPVNLALLPNGSPSGLFYYRTDVASF